ncbi:MAG: sirohydrochlorin chelatase, partial [Bacteroidota bacterium]
MRKNTLLIAAHGGTPQWNKLVESLAVNAAGLNDDNFDIVFSFLEKKPLISDSVIALDKKGSRNILCLPLFITDSKHLINDIPYELGLIYSGCKDMPPQFRLGANVTLGPHFGLSNEIKDIFLDRVKELSTDPDYEALIILMHGSARYS